jgi:hypothetical protein
VREGLGYTRGMRLERVLSRRMALTVLGCLLVSSCGKAGPTDEDLLEQFVKDVTGAVDEGLLTRAVGYTALDELPIDVRVPQHQGVYREDRAEELIGSFREGMRRQFGGSELKLRRHTIEIEGDHAEVGMRLITKLGPIQADIGLQKLSAGWRVNKVHAQPSGMF